MTARRLLIVLATTVLTLGGLAACGDRATEEPVDTTFEESYEEMRETDAELAEGAAGKDGAPDPSAAETEDPANTKTSQ